MKFKVSPKDMFGRTAIIAEVSEKKLQQTSGGSLASDYWNFIPDDAQQDASLNSSKYKRVLTHAQVTKILTSFSWFLALAYLVKISPCFFNFKINFFGEVKLLVVVLSFRDIFYLSY